MHPIVETLGSPDEFLDRLFEQLGEIGVDVVSLYMDHVCYRVESEKDYISLKNSLLVHGALLSDKIIGGRPISVVELDKGYIYNQRIIKVIELPSPKVGSSYPTGYEHVEFVVDKDLKEFIRPYPTIVFDLKGMHKKINRDVRLQLNGCSVKFHEHSLKYVIEEIES